MKPSTDGFSIRPRREDGERIGPEGTAPRPVDSPAMPFTDLLPARPESPLFVEWDSYRREVGRLLADGHQGRFALLKGQQIVGLYATEHEALDQGYQWFPGEPFLVHPVREREPVLRCISVRPCRA